MQMVYDSDSYAVMQFDVQAPPSPAPQRPAHASAAAGEAATGAEHAGGFEIVDKRGRADVYLHGAVAERFHRGAQALMQQAQGQPDVEVLDDYIAGFTTLGRQPLALH